VILIVIRRFIEQYFINVQITQLLASRPLGDRTKVRLYQHELAEGPFIEALLQRICLKLNLINCVVGWLLDSGDSDSIVDQRCERFNQSIRTPGEDEKRNH
jgi:hypothetical protein